MVVVDTSALVAALRPQDTNHAGAVHTLRTLAGERILLPWSALDETMMLIARRAGLDVQRRFWDAVLRGGYEIVPLDADVLRAARVIDETYHDSALGFFDSMLLATCERVRCARVFTFDRRHFPLYRPSFAAGLELLP